MKKYLSLVYICFGITLLFAQRHEIGIFAGGANGITDIGRSNYIYPFPQKYNKAIPSIPWNLGIFYRRNLNPFHSIRLQASYGKIIGNDNLAVEDYRYLRGATYINNLYEGALMYEFNFFPINSEQEKAISPYIFVGVAAFANDHLNYTVAHTFNRVNGEIVLPTSQTDFTTTITSKAKKEFSFTVPFGAGLKYKFNYNWIIAAEVGFRPTSSDNLDHAFVKPADFTSTAESGLTAAYPGIADEMAIRDYEAIRARQLGDYTTNDWYVFTGITLSYTFGRPPCFCD